LILPTSGLYRKANTFALKAFLVNLEQKKRLGERSNSEAKAIGGTRNYTRASIHTTTGAGKGNSY
jgi:hypothetical protein